MPERDPSQRKADLDWLYGREPSAEEQTRRLSEAEQAELARRRATAAAGRSSAPGSLDRAGSPAAAVSARPNPAVSGPAPSGSTPSSPTSSSRSVPGGAPTSTRPAATSAGATSARATAGAAAGRARDAGAAVAGALAGLGTRVRNRGGGTPPPSAGATALATAGGASGPHLPRVRWSRKRIILTVLGVVVAYVLFLLVTPLYAWSSMKNVSATPANSGRPAEQPGTAILLVGSDSRDGMTAAEIAKLRTGTDTGARTDTMMILYIPPSGKSALISLPRDSYVPIPGHGKNKLNAAFSIGGPQLLEQTVEQDTGVRLDGYLEIGMAGFANVVDAVGGITMCLKTALKDSYAHVNFPAGCQKFTGAQALGYVRVRHADPLGDIGRVARQRQMIAAIAKKIESPTTVLNPVKYWKVNMALRGALSRDGLGLTSLPSVSKGLMSIASGSGLQLTVPVSDTNATTAAGSSVLWDHDKALQLFHAIEQGDTSNLSQFAK